MRHWSWTLLIVFSLTGCASGSALAARDYDVGPKLIGCGSEADVGQGRSYERVRLRFTVDEHGSPVPATIRAYWSASNRPSSDAVAEAQQRAMSCSFEPAVKDGEPVAAVWGTTFDVPR